MSKIALDSEIIYVAGKLSTSLAVKQLMYSDPESQPSDLPHAALAVGVRKVNAYLGYLCLAFGSGHAHWVAATMKTDLLIDAVAMKRTRD